MKTKKLSEIIDSFESFEQLKDMVLLFDKNSKYFEWSGYVTGSLLDFYGDGVSILGIQTKNLGWLTIKRTKEELVDLLNNCIEFVGKTEEDSFILEK